MPVWKFAGSSSICNPGISTDGSANGKSPAALIEAAFASPVSKRFRPVQAVSRVPAIPAPRILVGLIVGLKNK